MADQSKSRGMRRMHMTSQEREDILISVLDDSIDALDALPALLVPSPRVRNRLDWLANWLSMSGNRAARPSRSPQAGKLSAPR